MGVTPAAVEGTLAQFGMTLGDVDAYAIPQQIIDVINKENIENLQLFAREMSDGRFVYLYVNGQEMMRLNWAARGMLVSSLESTGAVPAGLLGTINQGLDALEATGDVDADFGVTTHLYDPSTTANPLTWPKTQAEIDAEAEAAAQTEAETAAQAAEAAGCWVTVAAGDGPDTTTGRVAQLEGLTADQRAKLQSELRAQHARGPWFAGQTVEVSCPEETSGPTGTELGGSQPQTAAAPAAGDFVYVLESGPLPGETPADAAARLAPQGGFDRACLRAFFEAGDAKGLFAPGMPLPLPAACLADGN